MNAHDQAVLDQLSRKLDLIEKKTPMVGSYARIEPKILEKSECGVPFRFIVYHLESSSWFDNDNIDHASVAVRKLDLIQPNDIAFDLGCNSGYLTVWMAMTMPFGHVHAFDPYPWNTAATKAQADLNRLTNVTAHSVGIGNRKRIITTDAASSKSFNAPEGREDHKIDIRIEAANKYLKYSPTFLKIDIEGAEHELVETRLMSHWSVQRGYVEMHTQFIKDGGGEPAAFLNNLLANGYTVWTPHLQRADAFNVVDESAYYFRRSVTKPKGVIEHLSRKLFG